MEELLRIDNLSYTYPDGQQALKDINLTVYKGDSLALVGANGAGKSTLILHFNGIIRSDGNVRFMGEPIDEKNLKRVRSRVGLIFQNPDDQLFSPTVFDDVAFGPINMGYDETEVRESVANALKLVGMSGFEKRSPHHLSIGEKKRIAIATVLAMSPDLLVIDEPSSSLDPKGKWDFIDFLKHLSWTKIIVSHDLELVESLCSRMVIMEKGCIVADGLTADMLYDRKLLVKYGLARPEK
jgi:cobalt/nickel transport system ATP-binding protein